MLTRVLISGVLSLATLSAVPALAHDYKLGSLEIGHPWTRATPPTAQAGGGFLVITNTGTTADRLVAAKSDTSARIEVHEMKMDGTVMRMREVEGGLVIPPGGTVELKPGGYHIMFMGLKAPFAAGAKVPVTLVFEKAGSIDVELQVEAMGAAPQKHGH
ncbi:MAG: copper chaperone PCu(A)C [Reyranellaceae bacterium]